MVMKTPNLSPDKIALLEQRLGVAAQKDKTGVVIPKRPQQDRALLSFAQRQMWLIDQITPGCPAYNLPVGYRLRGALDKSALEKAFNQIIERHEILRTTFAVINDEPVQVIHPTCEIKIDVLKLDYLADHEREAEVHRLAAEEAVKTFDLSRLPLLRVCLFQLGKEEHVLIIILHHSVADGLSVARLLNELDTFYQAFTRGAPAQVPELVIQYADFAVWQRENLTGQSTSKQIEFWQQVLRGNLPALDLPCDRARPALQSFKGSNIFFKIPGPLVAELNAMGNRAECTFFMTILAAFSVVLQRYSGAAEVLIGTPISDRTPSEIEPLIGNFLNMIALRCNVREDLTFTELLRRSRETMLDAFSNGQLPFEKVIENLKFERDPSRNPIFQVMLQVLPDASPKIGELKIDQFHFDLGVAQFDLSLHLYKETGSYCGRMEYCTALFNADTVERLSRSLMRLLHEIVKDPDQPISKIPMLAEAEEKQLLRDWNDTSREYPAETVHQLLEKTAARAGRRVASEFAGRSLTYGELNSKANQLAHYLIRSGVTPGSFVGIYLDRSLDMLVALLGILKAGAAYVPMDPSFPAERLAYMADDAGITILVTRSDLFAQSSLADRRAIFLDTEWGKIHFERPTNPNLGIASTSLCYVIYTSGSTGKPKGVMVEHRSVVNFLFSMLEKPGCRESDVLVAITTISFDIAGLELLLPLASGAKVVIADKHEVVDGRLLLQLIKRTGATIMQATPATWKLMIEAGWEHTPGLKMLCGGESLSRELAGQMLERGGELWNMYGPTEATIWSSVYRVTGKEGSNPPVGRPIANTQIYLLDAHGNPVPVNVLGEICIGGDGVARGYLNQPELTAQKFIPDPFTQKSGTRLYRTGDRGRYRADGNIECAGRLDHQVKIRGFRIELGEIERALDSHAAIRRCVVVADEGPVGDKRLVAYFASERGKGVMAGELREHLKKQLPEYMLPSAFIALGALPMTPNGKIDRRALPQPNGADIGVANKFLPPRDSVERVLAHLWSKILRVKRIGLNDNFFELGGHSLLAVRIMFEIEKVLRKRLPLATLLQAPTIANLADVLRRENWTPPWSSLAPIRARGSKAPLFLMHAHGGNVLEYYSLANYFESDQPVYALQARGLDGQIKKDQSLEEMVADYVEELTSLQPEGPYFLGGFCFGGLLALEAAQQLTASGREVAFVALIQTMHPSVARFKMRTPLSHRWWYRTTKRIDLERENLSYRGSRYLYIRSRDLIDILWARSAIAFDHVTGNGHVRRARPPRRYIPESLRIEHDKAGARYKPRPYHGNVVLFRARKQLSGLMIDDWLGWKAVMQGNLDVREIPGHQENMLSEPNVSLIAKELSAHLRAAQAPPANVPITPWPAGAAPISGS